MPLRSLQPPQSVVLHLTTLTPLYTGGIGQHGEQLHPSGLLGSIRYFSGLVAKALGDGTFENRVWGHVQGDAGHAKQVAIQWDGRGLGLTKLPGVIRIIRVDGKDSSWFFNQALGGTCQLTLTRRDISDADWQILLLSLRIQIRHATFGAKDQFGLGVMGCADLPKVAGLANITFARPQKTDSLWHTAFFKAQLSKPSLRNDDVLNFEELLKLGLSLRYALRNSLRGNPDTTPDKNLRHIMLGALNEFGSAANISAAYPLESGLIPQFEVRMAVQLKPSESEQRIKVMNAFKKALEDFAIDDWHPVALSIEWGGGIGSADKYKFKTIYQWINHLAGV